MFELGSINDDSNVYRPAMSNEQRLYNLFVG